jgi:hypothetical protein
MADYVIDPQNRQYQIGRSLGAGATAAVYLGTATGAPDVAVKIAHRDDLDATLAQLFMGELQLFETLRGRQSARALPWMRRGRLPHAPARLCIIMELIPAEWQLDRQLRQCQGSASEALGVVSAQQYAALLHDLHEIGWSTRGDRKAGDFHWDESSRRLIVLDWNRAAPFNDTPPTQRQELIQQDLGSLAGLWAELLTGRRHQDVIRSPSEEDPRQTHVLSRELRRILWRAAGRSPVERYARARELVHDLGTHRQQWEECEQDVAVFMRRLEARQAELQSQSTTVLVADLEGCLDKADMAYRLTVDERVRERANSVRMWAQAGVSRVAQVNQACQKQIRQLLSFSEYQKCRHAISDALYEIARFSSDPLDTLYIRRLEHVVVAHEIISRTIHDFDDSTLFELPNILESAFNVHKSSFNMLFVSQRSLNRLIQVTNSHYSIIVLIHDIQIVQEICWHNRISSTDIPQFNTISHIYDLIMNIREHDVNYAHIMYMLWYNRIQSKTSTNSNKYADSIDFTTIYPLVRAINTITDRTELLSQVNRLLNENGQHSAQIRDLIDEYSQCSSISQYIVFRERLTRIHQELASNEVIETLCARTDDKLRYYVTEIGNQLRIGQSIDESSVFQCVQLLQQFINDHADSVYILGIWTKFVELKQKIVSVVHFGGAYAVFAQDESFDHNIAELVRINIKIFIIDSNNMRIDLHDLQMIRSLFKFRHWLKHETEVSQNEINTAIRHIQQHLPQLNSDIQAYRNLMTYSRQYIEELERITESIRQFKQFIDNYTDEQISSRQHALASINAQYQQLDDIYRSSDASSQQLRIMIEQASRMQAIGNIRLSDQNNDSVNDLQLDSADTPTCRSDISSTVITGDSQLYHDNPRTEQIELHILLWHAGNLADHELIREIKQYLLQSDLNLSDVEQFLPFIDNIAEDTEMIIAKWKLRLLPNREINRLIQWWNDAVRCVPTMEVSEFLSKIAITNICFDRHNSVTYPKIDDLRQSITKSCDLLLDVSIFSMFRRWLPLFPAMLPKQMRDSLEQLSEHIRHNKSN